MVVAMDQPTDVKRVLRDVERLVRPRLGAGVGLEVRTQSGQWPLSLGASELERLLVDLVLNARDAVAGGGLVSVVTGTVELDGNHLHPALAAGAYVLIRVSDDGAGLEGRPAPAKAHAAAEQAGGHIDLIVTPGRGTSRLAYLPARPRATVLVVEDEPAVRRMIGRILGRAGYRVIEAPGGPEALELLDSERADLVIADIVMPGLSGQELTARMRAKHPGLRVLYVSGYGQEMIERLGDVGDRLLPKPFGRDELIEAVGETLAR